MDCIANIINFYNRESKNMEDDPSRFNKESISKLLIKVMKNFNREKNNSLELQNCLILLVNLFSDDDSPDYYNKKGVDTQELINSDKIHYSQILRSEFLNN